MSDPIEAWQDAEWAPNDLSEPHDAGDALVSALEAALERCRQLEAALKRLVMVLDFWETHIDQQHVALNQATSGDYTQATELARAALGDSHPSPMVTDTPPTEDGDLSGRVLGYAIIDKEPPQPEETLTHEEKVARYGTTYGNPMKSWHELDLAPEPEGEL